MIDRLPAHPSIAQVFENVPPGWTYNPASWSERLPIIGVALLGFGIASYLALYQWNLFATVWEPFFSDGSSRVLHSFISRLLPIPDAALGAFAYLLDAAPRPSGARLDGARYPGWSCCLDWLWDHSGSRASSLSLRSRSGCTPGARFAWCRPSCR
jgi:hypothetical protein